MYTEEMNSENINYNESTQVSVIVPVYNSEKYLTNCIDSILRQTHINFELILVDDGSTDTSGEICDNYANNNCKIKVLHKENGGQNSARLYGLSVANFDYIMFVDSDDWIDADYIERMLIIKGNKDFGIVTSGLIFEKNENKNFFIDQINEGIYSHEEIYRSVINRFFLDSESGGQGITHSLSNKLMEKKLLTPIIADIDKDITICEDGAVLFCMLLEAHQIKVSHYCGYHYIQHKESAIHSYDQDDIWKLDLLRKYYIKQFNKYGVYSDYLNNCLIKFISLNAEKALAHFWGYEKVYSLAVPSKLPGNVKRVIVYGAGIKGKEFVSDLEACGRYSVIAWADKKHKLAINGHIKMILPEQIVDIDYDCIFVAIMNRYVAKDVENFLVDMGIDSKKIWIVQIEEKYQRILP